MLCNLVESSVLVFSTISSFEAPWRRTPKTAASRTRRPLEVKGKACGFPRQNWGCFGGKSFRNLCGQNIKCPGLTHRGLTLSFFLYLNIGVFDAEWPVLPDWQCARGIAGVCVSELSWPRKRAELGQNGAKSDCNVKLDCLEIMKRKNERVRPHTRMTAM